MDVTFSYIHDLDAILEAVEPSDRDFHLLAIVHAARSVDLAAPPPILGTMLLYELQQVVDDLTYGLVLEPRSWGFDVRAYWRDPATASFDRITAINLALQRRSDP